MRIILAEGEAGRGGVPSSIDEKDAVGCAEIAKFRGRSGVDLNQRGKPVISPLCNPLRFEKKRLL